MKRLTLLAAILLVLSACAGSDASNEMSAGLDEWSIDLSSDRFEPGRVTIDVDNLGEFPHTLVVEAVDGAVIAATDVIAPGQKAVLEIDLGNEGYRFTCRIVASSEDGSVIDHFAEGMAASATAG